MRKWLRHLSNLPGWCTKRKIVVIESDDWGSIRMPSLQVAKRLRKKGLNLGKGESYRYNKYDTLASSSDLCALYETLSSFKDALGRNPVFTVVSLVANPDFDKIKTDDFSRYHCEPFTRTLERYGQADAWPLWQEGKKLGLFCPEFHGREHLNVAAWLRALRRRDLNTFAAFREGCWGFENKHSHGLNYQSAFDLEKTEDLKLQEFIIVEGLELFVKLHNRPARFFVPPNGPFNNNLERVAATKGIEYMSAAKIQREPLGEGKTHRRFHYLGQKNQHGQHYITRNTSFEPSAPGQDWVSSCLRDIDIAFRWHKPAVISSHRVNYVGGLDPKNRHHGIQQLKNLLAKIIQYWPEVEFMTSTELGDLIANKVRG